jgi:hypothetical protein
MIIKEHNTTTGEIIEREMNESEIAQCELDKAFFEAEKIAEAAKAAKKAALLERLGITADEAVLLLS